MSETFAALMVALVAGGVCLQFLPIGWHGALPSLLRDYLATADPMYTNWTDRAIPLFVIAIVVEMAFAIHGTEHVAEERLKEVQRWAQRGKSGNDSKRKSSKAGVRGSRPVYAFADTVTSVSLGALQQLTNVVLIRALMIVPVCFLWDRFAIVRLPADSPWTHALCFFLVEHGYYWYHRMGHEVNLFWSFHAVHHSGEIYNLATALRQGWAQYAFAFLFYAPIGLLVPPEVFSVWAHANRIYQFWIHTTAIGSLPAPLEWFLCTPSHHRVHHGSNPEYIDKNYGGTVIIFDRLYGTFEPEDAPVVYGLTTNVGTWNPISINGSHLCNMLRLAVESCKASGKKRKGSHPCWSALRVLWVGPAWTPDGPADPPPAAYGRSPHAYQRPKRHTPVSLFLARNGYVALLALQVILWLKVATRAVYVTESSATAIRASAHTVAASLSAGLALDGSRWSRAFELVRLAGLVAWWIETSGVWGFKALVAIAVSAAAAFACLGKWGRNTK